MNNDFKIKFGLRIKELRLAKKYTQEQLAERMEMERSNLAKIEAGNHFPSVENLEKFASVLNVEPFELFTIEHFKSKEMLINEILCELNNFDVDKIQYIYKSIMYLKSLK